LKKLLNSIDLPDIGQAIGDIGRVVSVSETDGCVSAQVELGFPAEGAHGAYRALISEAIREATGCKEVTVELSTQIVAHGVQRNLKPLEQIRNVIAVASGKGGVGKSTVAVNLALALSADGASVGLLDADIYGPSQPHMLGVANERPTSADGKTMQPMQAHGLQVMSIGFLVDADQPMVWRGPMVTSALNQLLQQTTPVSGAVIVTTPQDIALIDARKGLAMFRKVSVPVLGVIENMSTHVCSACGHEEAIFGEGGGERMAGDFEVELLGQLPLDAKIRELTDSGNPTVIGDPESAAALAYRQAARRMTARLAMSGKDYSSKFPNIVVEAT
jgi:ATP-binding protein involved in chromosome partitioning